MYHRCTIVIRDGPRHEPSKVFGLAPAVYLRSSASFDEGFIVWPEWVSGVNLEAPASQLPHASASDFGWYSNPRMPKGL
jgi:hypothetical protein